MLKKNDIVKVEITDIGFGGEGIAKKDGYTLFIKNAAIGDVVMAKIFPKKQYPITNMRMLNVNMKEERGIFQMLFIVNAIPVVPPVTSPAGIKNRVTVRA